MHKIRTLIVDHCPQMRQALEDLFGLQREFEVVGAARHGLDALARITLQTPDLIITERDMPVMNGIDMLIEVRKKHPKLPVVVFDNSMERGSTATVEMLLHGANGYIVKPPGGAEAIRLRGCPSLLEKALSCMGRTFSHQPVLPELADAFSTNRKHRTVVPPVGEPAPRAPAPAPAPRAPAPAPAPRAPVVAAPTHRFAASAPAPRPAAAPPRPAAAPPRPTAAPPRPAVAPPRPAVAPPRPAAVSHVPVSHAPAAPPKMAPAAPVVQGSLAVSQSPSSAYQRAVAASGRADALGGPRAVGIGVSTGGPDALATLLSHLPGDLHVPVFIVQHMPPLFTATLSERLNRIFPGVVSEAREGELAEPGHIYVAPGGKHMVLEMTGHGVRIGLNEDPPENHCRPAVDVLFRSIARVYGKRSLAVILTGMGNDGLEGCRVISEAGGTIFVQSKDSSTVWGMPRAVFEADLHDKVLDLEDMGHMILHALHYFDF